MNDRFISFGEIMLRLTAPDHKLFFAADSFDAYYGGAEANIAVSLANLGVDSAFFSVVPDNDLGKSAARMLRGNGVDCSPLILAPRSQAPTHRLGVYYMETGFGVRPSKVIYDRKHSAITEFDFSAIDPQRLLAGRTWLHLSGITPALSPSCAQFVMRLAKTAKELGLTVSFDGNYRSALWDWEAARDYCTGVLPYVDVLFGIEPYHIFTREGVPESGDVKEKIPFQPDFAQQDSVFRIFSQRYPNLRCIARHVRFAHSGSENSLKAYLWLDGQTFESKLFTFGILDRVGGGDAFAAGLIYAHMKGFSPEEMINFAVAASALKHTVRGDANITDDEAAIRGLMNMNYDIKR